MLVQWLAGSRYSRCQRRTRGLLGSQDGLSAIARSTAPAPNGKVVGGIEQDRSDKQRQRGLRVNVDADGWRAGNEPHRGSGDCQHRRIWHRHTAEQSATAPLPPAAVAAGFRRRSWPEANGYHFRGKVDRRRGSSNSYVGFLGEWSTGRGVTFQHSLPSLAAKIALGKQRAFHRVWGAKSDHLESAVGLHSSQVGNFQRRSDCSASAHADALSGPKRAHRRAQAGKRLSIGVKRFGDIARVLGAFSASSAQSRFRHLPTGEGFRATRAMMRQSLPVVSARHVPQQFRFDRLAPRTAAHRLGLLEQAELARRASASGFSQRTTAQ
jgi:hypothetical protein